MRTKKMYVLVRNDLAEKYRFVQGSHALAQFALEFSDLFHEWNNSTIVFLGVRNYVELRNIPSLLQTHNKLFSCFFEPDLEQVTAIACYDDGFVFKDLKIA
jgi:hypothetical protein